MGISIRRGFCGCCVRLVKWLPVLFISAIVAWSYYAFVVHLCVLTVLSLDGFPVFFVLMVPYHLLFTLFIWSYWKTVFSSPGRVPKRFRLANAEVDLVEGASDPKEALEQLAIAKDLPVFMRSMQGEVRYCSECCHIKPDRTHHCSVCDACILKMDHHCPWVNNCVGFSNYKFFVLFLTYAVTYCLFIALSTLKYFLLFWSDDPGHALGKFHVLFLFFVSAMFCVSALSLCSYHIFLVLRNQTTLESFRAPIFRYNLNGDKKGFYLGTFNNFQEIFGDNKLQWFLPIFTSFGDGVVFPQRGQNVDEEMGLPSLPSRVGSTSGIASAEEMVPMINATQFDDDESDEGNMTVWTDHHNQRTMVAGNGIQDRSQLSTSSSETAAVLDIDEHAQVSLKNPRNNRFENGSNNSRAITGDLITVDTI